MKKLVLFTIIILFSSSVFALCSYPSQVNCDSYDEVNQVGNEWINNTCTQEELMACANNWIKISELKFSKLDGWYCGDTHYHTIFTNVNGERGWDMGKTSNEINRAGLDFFFATDHSNSIKHLGGATNWENFKERCNFDSYGCLIGEEINCDYSHVMKNVFPYYTDSGNHILSYNYLPYIDDGSQSLGNIWPIPTTNTPSCSSMINTINKNGFVYVAHPESEFSTTSINNPAINLVISLILNYLGVDEVKIISKFKDYSLPFTGLEVWNGNIEDNEVKLDLANGLERWKELLLDGRKVYISGGTDTHGDTCGYDSWIGSKNCTYPFASVATCVNAGSFTKSNIINAFKNGKSYVTNNGALVMEISNRYKPEMPKAEMSDTIKLCKDESILIKFTYNISDKCHLKLKRGIIGQSDEDLSETQGYREGYGTKETSDLVNSNRYYRAECISDNGLRRIYTNPIWVEIDESDSDNDGICDMYDTIYNIAPTNGITITRNTLFNYGTYNLPDGIKISGENIVVDCQNSILIGTRTQGSKGISINGYNITLKNCMIKNYWTGISLAGTNSLIKSNSISDNGFIGIETIINQPYGHKLENNDIFNNVQYNLYNSLSGNINAENNWWGIINITEIETKINRGEGLVDFSPFSQTSFFNEYIPCNPSWSCTDWSTCSNKQQSRTCNDINNCGVLTGKPSETQSCSSSSSSNSHHHSSSSSSSASSIVVAQEESSSDDKILISDNQNQQTETINLDSPSTNKITGSAVGTIDNNTLIIASVFIFLIFFIFIIVLIIRR